MNNFVNNFILDNYATLSAVKRRQYLWEIVGNVFER